ncbi:MAG: hypothetical protein ICV60_20160 [Pyrinomonadaceae bacterium]|nr:hypothetical protein [Pyrinomonadaceae bacterium]
MNRIKALFSLLLLLASGLLLLSPKVTGQIKPNSAGGDPCTFPNPPDYCAPAPTPTPRDPRKGISLGAASVLRVDEITWDQSLLGPGGLRSNISILNDSHTGYVKLWVDWPALQLDPEIDLFNEAAPKYIEKDNSTDNPPAVLLKGLDDQIKEARRNGLKVILTMDHRYPLWITNESLPKDVKNEIKKFINKLDPYNRVPDRLGVDSAWGKWMKFLVRRYGLTQLKKESNRTGPAGEAIDCNTNFNNEVCKDYLRYVDFLEVVNEPNSALWPQGTDKNPFMAKRVARMFKTAQQVVRDNSEPGTIALKLAGPATSDTLRDDARITSYQRFTKDLLRELGEIAFKADGNFVWSHHNYLDVEEQRNCAPDDEHCTRPLICIDGDCKRATPCSYYTDVVGKKRISRVNSVAWVESKLERLVDGYKWQGMRDPMNHPAILLTEGGARLDRVFRIYACRLGLPQPPERFLCRCFPAVDIQFPCSKAPQNPIGGECVVEGDNPEYAAFVQAAGEKMDLIKKWQAALVKESFNLMTQPGPLSKGVILFTNYLTYTDPVYDTGMFDITGSCEQYRAKATGQRLFGDICTGEYGGNQSQDGRPLYEMWKMIPLPQGN